jgi:hypothetical protein
VDGAQTTFEHGAGMSTPATKAGPCGAGQNGRKTLKSAPKNHPNPASPSTSEIHRLNLRYGGGCADLP